MRAIRFVKSMAPALATKALRPIWPGVVYSRLSPTRMVDLPDPPLPGDRWVRVANRLGGICGSDLHLLFVEASPFVMPAMLPGSDTVYLGHEVLSTVVEIGAGVRSLSVGDRVILDAPDANCLNQERAAPCLACLRGDYWLCEHQSRPEAMRRVGGGWGDGMVAHETQLYRVPAYLDDEQALLVEPLSVGVRAALKGAPEHESHVLVIGCGMIGLAVVGALAALCPDVRVTALARHSHQRDLALDRGARVEPGSLWEDGRLHRLTGASVYRGPLGGQAALGGFDVVYDCVGTADTLQASLRWCRSGGRVVLAGIRLDALRVDLSPIWFQEVDLIGLYGHGMEVWHGETISTYDLTVKLVREGRLLTEGLVTHRYPLRRWRDAVRVATDKRRGSVKVVLDPTP